MAIKRHEFLRKPTAAVAQRPVAPSLEVSRCATRTVEPSAPSSLPPQFASGSARLMAADRADATPTHSSAACLALTPSYAVLLEAA